MRHLQLSGSVAFVAIVLGAVIEAADIGKALAEAESRRRAAENGVQEIQRKSPPNAAELRSAYTDAEPSNNAWLDALVRSLEQSTAPEVAMAESAAKSFVAWVTVRNRALGEPEITAAVGEGVRKGVVQNLVDISTQE
jgi:hypothetical protein